ncbi:hypothetical protein L6R53_05035 [Myxococcota bacterium]|nr:hypothetical protein [Myxococcota bacterium]
MSEAETAWRPAAPADLMVGQAPSGAALDAWIDLNGDGRAERVRIEVDDAAGQARVVVVGGPILGEMPPAPHGPVSTGLWAHPPGAAPLSDRAPDSLRAFSQAHALVEWCLPPPGQPWSAGSACYGARFVGVEGGVVRSWEVWD